MNNKINRRWAILFFLLLSAGITPQLYAQNPKFIRFSEAVLRKRATRVVMPEFPEEARKHGAKGVAVAELEIDEKGNVARVDILEAPDPTIKQAVTEATLQWKFSPSTINGEPVKIIGKRTFYYVINDGKGRVENPKAVN